MADSELERVFVTFLANDKDLERTYQQIVRRAKEVSAEVGKAFDASVSKGFTNAGEKVARSAKKQADAVDEVEEAFKALRNETAALRHTVEAGDTTNEKAIKRFNELQQAALHQARGFEVTTDEYRKFTQVAAQASRSVATLEGRTTKLGFSANNAVGVTAALRQHVDFLGRGGNAAAKGLGIASVALGGFMTRGEESITVLQRLRLGVHQLAIALPLLAAAGFVGVSIAMFRMGKAASEAADEIDKGSQSAGLSAEAYQELRFAFEQNGVEAAQFDQALQALNRRLGLAAQGNATYAKAYEELGISIRDANGNLRGTEELVMEVVTALSELPSAAEQAAYASTIFNDDVGKKLIPAIRQGGEALQRLRDQAREMGLVLTNEGVKSLVEFKDSLNVMQRQLETARTEIVAAFIPVFTKSLIPLFQNTVVPWLQNVATAVQGFSQKFLDQGEAGVAFRKDMLMNLEAVITIGRGVVAAAAAVAGAVQSILSVSASIGGFLGGLSAAGTDRATREGLEQTLEQLNQAIDRADTAETRQRLIGLRDDILRQLEGLPKGFLDSGRQAGAEAGANFADGALASFQTAMDALTFDIEGMVENWSRNASAAVELGASSFAAGVDDAFGTPITPDLGMELPPEGSLAELRARAADARKEFENAVTDEARAASLERIRILETEIAVMESIMSGTDPLAPARTWVRRLTAELDFGLKSANEVFALIFPRVEQLREQATAALKEFGVDSPEYQLTVAKLEALLPLLDRVSEERKVKLTLEPSAELTGSVRDLLPPDVAAEVLDRPLAEALFLIHMFSSDASDDFKAARESWDDFTGNVALGAATVQQAFNASADAVRIMQDTIAALIQSGDVDALMALVERSPLAASLVMGFPGGEVEEQLPVLKAALAEQEAAWAAVQAAMTEEQLVEAGRRHQAATAEVERLRDLYSGAEIPAPQLLGDNIHEVLAGVSRQFAVAEAAALAFGDSSGLAAEKQAILESAIRRILELNPAADVASLVFQWELFAAQAGDTTDEVTDLTGVLRDLESAQARVAELTGTAPTQWDEMRDAFKAAAAQGLITREELERLLEILAKLQGEAEGLSKLREIATNIDFGTDIAEGLTNGLNSLAAGDLTGALGNLRTIGTAVGTLLGNSAVGALVGAIGGAIAALPALFQAISDIFTGDSPARRELAKNLTVTIQTAVRQGIEAGLRGADDWREQLRTGIRESVVGALVDAFIEAAVTQAIIAPFIDQFTLIMQRQGRDAALAFLQANLEGILSQAEAAAADIVRLFDRFFDDIDQPTVDAGAGVFDLPSATVGVIAAPDWATDLTFAAVDIREGGVAIREAAEMMKATFQAGINVNNTSERGIDAHWAAQ